MWQRISFGVVLLAAACAALAQTYPVKPITVVVPFAAGGPGDGLMRSLAQALTRQLKQSIVIENVGGASGNIGVSRVARAAPDGYTMLYHNLGMSTAPGLYRKLDFNPLTDFEYIGMMSTSPNVLVSRIDFPAASLKELLAHLKANQDKVSIADAGPGGPAGLCALLLMSHTGTKLTQVSYKGTAPAMTDLLGRQVDLLCDGAATAANQIRAGKVKAFGVSGLRRLPSLPALPTLDEQGMTGFEMVVWNAMYAPKSTAKPALDRFVAAFQAALDDPEFTGYLEKVGSQPVPKELATPAGLQAYLKADIAKWSPLLKAAGVSAD